MARKQPKAAGGLAGAIKELISQKHTVDTGSLLTGIIERFGGAEAIAQEMVDEYFAGKRGSLARQKFWQMFQSLVISATGSNMTKRIRPEELSDEDLQELAGEYFSGIKIDEPEGSGSAE